MNTKEQLSSLSLHVCVYRTWQQEDEGEAMEMERETEREREESKANTSRIEGSKKNGLRKAAGFVSLPETRESEKFAGRQPPYLPRLLT